MNVCIQLTQEVARLERLLANVDKEASCKNEPEKELLRSSQKSQRRFVKVILCVEFNRYDV